MTTLVTCSPPALDSFIIDGVLDFYKSEAPSKSTPAWTKRKKEYVKRLEDIVHNDSENLGLPANYVESFIDVITKHDDKKYALVKKQKDIVLNSGLILGQNGTQSAAIISCLVPTEKISVNSIRTFALWAITNRYRLDIKFCLQPALRWINCVLQYEICSVTDLQCLYEAFFQLLIFKPLRSIVADILFKLTANKKDLVTKWRVEKAKKISHRDLSNAQLTALMLRMQDLKPEYLPHKIKGKRGCMKAANGRMEQTFAAIWRQARKGQDDLDIPLDIWNIPDEDPRQKKRFNCLVPSLTDDRLTSESGDTDAVSISDCKTLKDLLNNVTKLKRVNQAMSLLRSPHSYYLLFLTRDLAEVQERLSITLYYTLHNTFFSLAESHTSRNAKRKLDILCRINQLQDYFQQGLPVVGRFLSVYLATWDGEEFFIEICKMLVYLQLNEPNEFEECILTPLRSMMFNSKLSCIHQLVILTYLSKLAQHWAAVEYERCKNCLIGPFPMTHVTFEKGPLHSIYYLTEEISQMAETGFCHLLQTKHQEDADVFRLHINTFIQETLYIFHSISHCYTLKEIPIRPKVPQSILYAAIFGRNPVLLSRALEYITMVKEEILPMISKVGQQMKDDNDDQGFEVAALQQGSLEDLNVVSKDALSLMSKEEYLNRGESIFRQDWIIDDELVRKGLSLASHPALFPYLLKHLQDNQELDLSTLDETDSRPFEDYMENLANHLPKVTHFFDTFTSRKTTEKTCDAEGSVSTSGISSMLSSAQQSRTRKRRNLS